MIRTIAFLFAAVLLPVASAQIGASVDEQAIRALINKEAGGEEVPYTDDTIFVGVYPRPIIGYANLVEERKKRRSDPKTRRDNQKLSIDLVRIEVAKSGDLAYEFENNQMSFDEGGKHSDLSGSRLRIWKKVNGQWRVAASFTRVNDTP